MANDNVKASIARGDGLSGAAVFGALAALVLISYAGMFRADFAYDDYFQLVENISIRDLRNIPLFFTDPAKTTTSMIFEEIYRPLRTTCFASIRPNVMIWLTFSSPYFARAYSIISSRRT